MPALLAVDASARKRKRQGDAQTNGLTSRKAPKAASHSQAQILLLEDEILDSDANLNNIVALQKVVDNASKKPRAGGLAAVSLCRAFCRLLAGDRFVKRRDHSDAEAKVVQWLRARLQDYVESLASLISGTDATQENLALTLLMRIVKEETSRDSNSPDQAWRSEKSTFHAVITTLLDKNSADGARHDFVEKYMDEHDDVRFFTLVATKQCFSNPGRMREDYIRNSIDLLSRLENIPDSDAQLDDWYGKVPGAANQQLLSLSAHHKIAQECWLSIFRSNLAPSHRKKILEVMTNQVLPWFHNRTEILTDFLTDSFNAGGSHSLLALSGIFYLMTQRNVDYPDFYTKLYSLLDEDVLHSKHRSHFFKLFGQFMDSSHLPASMVASFIKRLSRLSLQAPPGAIAWIIPWTYNMLQSHPTCAFMLHRQLHPAHVIWASNPNYMEEGIHDTFSVSEPDPLYTHALASSLWELHSLADHWHPNVATLARILSQPFTRREFRLEDFLDHSYAGLIEPELAKEMKRVPEVEWDIPKRITMEEVGDDLNGLGKLLQAAMEESNKT